MLVFEHLAIYLIYNCSTVRHRRHQLLLDDDKQRTDLVFQNLHCRRRLYDYLLAGFAASLAAAGALAAGTAVAAFVSLLVASFLASTLQVLSLAGSHLAGAAATGTTATGAAAAGAALGASAGLAWANTEAVATAAMIAISCFIIHPLG